MSLIAELKRRNVVRVATAYIVTAWLIIQVAETVLPVFGYSEQAIRNIIVLLAIGFIPAIVLSWAFQLTPEGLKRDRGGEELPTDAGAMRRLDRAIIAVLLVGMSYFAIDKFVLAPERAAEREAEVAEQAKAEALTGYYGDRSIAVLPFDNLSADPEQRYFVDGIAEEVLNLLARIRQLRVISRSSSFALRDNDLEIPEIAERLDVAHILEGSVRKMGNTVRVTAQLIEARTDTHLWSKTYERDLENVFAIQDEIAQDVADNLHIRLLDPMQASRRVDPETVALTQQARQIYEQRPRDTGARMSVLIERAIEIDPNHAPAWEWKVYADWFLEGEGLIGTEEQERRDLESRRRILELEPDTGFLDFLDAYEAFMAGRLEDAAALYARSVSKDPANSEIARVAGAFARALGRFDIAVRLGRHAVAIDPLCYQCLYQLSRTYLFTGDYEAAHEMRRRFLALSNAGGRYQFGQMLLLQGKAAEALEYFQSIERKSPFKYAGMAMAYHALGDAQKAHDALERPSRETMEFDANQTHVVLAQAHAFMGEPDKAFERLQRAADEHGGFHALNPMSPLYRNLHDDPRWEELLTALGLSPARLAAIEFDPPLPE